MDSVNGAAGQFGGPAAYAEGQVSLGFEIGDESPSVGLPAGPRIDVGQGSGFTLEFWYRTETIEQPQRILAWEDSDNEGVNIEYTRTTRRGIVRRGNRFNLVDDQGVNHQIVTGILISQEEFTHLALTYHKASGVGRVYRNGVLVADQPLGSFTPETGFDLVLGGNPAKSQQSFGVIDEFSLYNRALEPFEIFEIFSAGAIGKCPIDDNLAPTVDAGPDKSVASEIEGITLEGMVSDDGLPVGVGLSAEWRQLSGPGIAVFDPPSSSTLSLSLSLSTQASFSESGIYVLELAAEDGAIRSTDTVEVRVGTLYSAAPIGGIVGWWPGNGTFETP